MSDKLCDQLRVYRNDADLISSEAEGRRWSRRVNEFLTQALGPEAAERFRSLAATNIYDELALKCGYIEGLMAQGGAEPPLDNSETSPQRKTGVMPVSLSSRRVFVVHGHDSEVKETVARFLEKLGLEPVILHEQPSQGRTIIEKFEVSSSDVAFAVVLLTPDDAGGTKEDPTYLQPRARQNVILELGYFLGRLGRTRVCALHREGVELPSDYQGVLYIEFDSAGAWKAKLAQEFVEAKLTINLQGLIQ